VGVRVGDDNATLLCPIGRFKGLGDSCFAVNAARVLNKGFYSRFAGSSVYSFSTAIRFMARDRAICPLKSFNFSPIGQVVIEQFAVIIFIKWQGDAILHENQCSAKTRVLTIVNHMVVLTCAQSRSCCRFH
jgi:hypothetical protein